MDEEYLKLFEESKNFDNNNFQNYENLSKPKNNDYQQWENLNKPNHNYNQWQKLNEINKEPRKYNINENLNDGWGNLDFQIETRINGIKQNNTKDLNGLNKYLNKEDLIEENANSKLNKFLESFKLNETYDLSNVDIVTIEMFENMNNNAMVTLLKNKFINIDPSKVTTTENEREVRFLGS